MRFRALCLLVLLVGATLTLSLIRGQERRPDAPKPTPAPPAAKPAGPAPARDLSRLEGLPLQMLLSAQSGADWLYRNNGVKGRFRHGYHTAVRQEMAGDHFLRQVGAAFALARAARLTNQERYAARATQAVLALLDETAADPKDASVRYTTLPPAVVNRLAAAGLLVLAVHELPAPQPDLLDKAEQLCAYVRRQARSDGSLACHESPDVPTTDDEVNTYPGLALHGLMRSQQRRPAGWKLDVARKAVGHYAKWWRGHKGLAFVPSQTAACAEAYLLTREKAFADFVVEMNDWSCTMQYAQIDPRRQGWYGGFMGYADGRAVESAPDVQCAPYVEGLADACRVARAAGDAERLGRYTDALVRGLQFLTTLQYTTTTTRHFVEWYRPELVGGFHASATCGDLRVDYTQHAVGAMFGYLEHVAR